jgi:hypothetical protein
VRAAAACTNVSHILCRRTWQPPALEPSALLHAAWTELAADPAYWSYHVARTAFFAAQGVAGLLASGSLRMPVTGAAGADALAAAARLVAEAMATYKQDVGNITRGVYAAPWDMSPRHRQFSPAFVADRGARFIAEAAATLRRRDEAKPDTIWLRSALYPECAALALAARTRMVAALTRSAMPGGMPTRTGARHGPRRADTYLHLPMCVQTS